MIAFDTREALDSGQIRLVGGAELPAAERLSFSLIAGGSTRIAGAGLSLRPPNARPTEPASPERIGRRGEGDVWKALGRGLWTEGRSAATILFWEETPGQEQLVACHDGYRRLRGRPIHRRRLRRAGTEWRVMDEISGRGRQEVELRFHLPRAVIAADSEGARVVFADGGRLRLRVECWHAPEAAVAPGWRALAGDSDEPCPILIYRWHTRLPFEVETVWEVGRAMAAPARSASEEETTAACIPLFGGRRSGAVRRAPGGWPELSGVGVPGGPTEPYREPGGGGERW